MFFYPVNQLVSFVFRSICFLFLAMCSLKFNLQSKCVPRYFTASLWGLIVRLMLPVGQWPFRRVNVTSDDLDSLNFIFQFFSHFPMMCECPWRLSETIVRSSWVANITVSSANFFHNWGILSCRGTIFHIQCWYQSISCAISHCVKIVSNLSIIFEF